MAMSPVLSRLNLRIDPDDRIALLGRNGNGKTTLARLLAGAVAADGRGKMNASGQDARRLFHPVSGRRARPQRNPAAAHDAADEGRTPGGVRAQLGRFGFSGAKATTEVGKLSGGERARLALALITRDAPHMLILDEPTNHLDVDAREALIQALNDYSGAVVIVSHDRHMLEMTADRLVLVDQGTAKDFDGSIDDYIAFVLAKDPVSSSGGGGGKPAVNKKEQRRAAAEARERDKELRVRAKRAEAELERLTNSLSTVDAAMFDPASAPADLAKLTMTDLMKRRAEVQQAIAAAELAWLEASEALEGMAV
jgi:ATP-binding cassette subfamily F protein 3